MVADVQQGEAKIHHDGNAGTGLAPPIVHETGVAGQHRTNGVGHV